MSSLDYERQQLQNQIERNEREINILKENYSREIIKWNITIVN
jgi:hypothetical protein